MEYHTPQFEDHSLIVESNGHWLAIFPAHQKDTIIFSHQGLTFGGWIGSMEMTTETYEAVIAATLTYYKRAGFLGLEFKPGFYPLHLTPVDFKKFGFEKTGAKPVYLLDLPTMEFPKSKMQGVKKAEKAGIYLERDGQFEPFWELLTATYEQKLGIRPVHTLIEIKKLATQHSILQYNVYQKNTLLAGATVYAFDDIIRTQYLAVSDEGKALGAMDFLMYHLIQAKVKLLDLGGVTDPRTDQPTETLSWWKKSFGAKAHESEVWSIRF